MDHTMNSTINGTINGTVKHALLVLQLIFALIFGVSFIASFFLVDNIAASSKQAVTQKVISMTQQKALFAEEILRSKAAEKYLQTHQREALQQELTRFKQDPDTYVSAIVEGSSHIAKPLPASKNPLTHNLLEKIFTWKSSLKSYFTATFTDLVFDLRIFLFSNALGLLIAAWMIWHLAQLNNNMVVVSIILTISIILSSMSYVDRNWFYTILLKNYAGWAYPMGIISLCTWLCFEYFKENKTRAKG